MASSRQTRLRSEKFSSNITKRGLTQSTVNERVNKDQPTVSPLLLGFFFFILVGSSIFQIVRNAQSGPVF